MKEEIQHAMEVIQAADALLIGAGAGMGVDSGLPDFRGPKGFWQAYPPLKKLGIAFEKMANPRWFRENPALAWGFYGHRLQLYRKTTPHNGYKIILKWIEELRLDYFIFTSNVDTHFQKVGFDENKIYECHGSIMQFQCSHNCGQEVWMPSPDFQLLIEEHSLEAKDPLPLCPTCKAIARPNILMFSDWDWDSKHSSIQQRKYRDWLDQNRHKNLLVLEIGAGENIPTVRLECESVYSLQKAPFIRINPIEYKIPRGGISIQLGGMQALEEMEKQRGFNA